MGASRAQGGKDGGGSWLLAFPSFTSSCCVARWLWSAGVQLLGYSAVAQRVPVADQVCALCPCWADVCLNGPAKQARQLALMLRDHPAGLSTRHMLTGELQGGLLRSRQPPGAHARLALAGDPVKGHLVNDGSPVAWFFFLGPPDPPAAHVHDAPAEKPAYDPCIGAWGLSQAVSDCKWPVQQHLARAVDGHAEMDSPPHALARSPCRLRDRGVPKPAGCAAGAARQRQRRAARPLAGLHIQDQLLQVGETRVAEPEHIAARSRLTADFRDCRLRLLVVPHLRRREGFIPSLSHSSHTCFPAGPRLAGTTCSPPCCPCTAPCWTRGSRSWCTGDGSWGCAEFAAHEMSSAGANLAARRPASTQARHLRPNMPLRPPPRCNPSPAAHPPALQRRRRCHCAR